MAGVNGVNGNVDLNIEKTGTTQQNVKAAEDSTPLVGAASGKTTTNGIKSGVSSDAVASKIAELKQKYSAEKGGGDAYTSNNPQLKAFQKAMEDGVIADMGQAGFTKTQIVDVISEVFPSIGIKSSGNGGYTCPYGHDKDAKAIYEAFTKELNVAAGTSPEILALQAEIAQMNAKITQNNEQLQVLKPTIKRMQKEVEDAIEKAIKESKEIADDQKEAAASLVKKELNTYANSDGSMTYEEFEKGLGSKLDSLSSDGEHKLSSVILKLMKAESKMDTLKGYVELMGNLVNENAELTGNIADKTSEMDSLKEELANTEDPDCHKCDPIGFTDGDSRYDFFVDKDSNGKLSNEKEFLGADNGWDEMASLDANNDGKVDKSEMKDLKMVVTNKDGTQAVKDASDVFKDGDSINLESYKGVNKDMKNGNTLLGTFGLTFDGKENTSGYNTLDKIDWLDKNYDFSDKDEGKNRFAKDVTEKIDALDYSEDVKEFEAKNQELELKLEDAWQRIGINRAEIEENIKAIAASEGASEALKIEDNFEQIAKEEQEAKEAKEAEAEAETQPVQETEDANEDPDKKKDEK